MKEVDKMLFYLVFTKLLSLCGWGQIFFSIQSLSDKTHQEHICKQIGFIIF
jgi:hypothetical protein